MERERGGGSMTLRAAAEITRNAESEVPWIFLSHSGSQKDFTRRLFHELIHTNHCPFFDEDSSSLPGGLEYPLRILQACHGCKMGIIVLSHQYIESFWPMLELQTLLLCRNSNAITRPIFPIFYELQPGDLSKAENLMRWKRTWESKVSYWQAKMQKLQSFVSSLGNQFQISMDVSSWPKVLESLAYQKGEIRSLYENDHVYIQAIVAKVCSTLPPPHRYSLGDDIKGKDRMQQGIDEIFKKQTSAVDGVCTLGVFGIGGSGKTTMCLNMTNFYNRDYPGRSFCLELPSNEDEMQLVSAIKAILPAIAQTSTIRLKEICKVDEAMAILEEGLKRKKVFLALDNVWDLPGSGLERAKKIALMDCVTGSKIMVTSRSREVLERLLRSRLEKTCASNQQHRTLPLCIVQVPSMSEMEAVEALMSYSCFSYLIPAEAIRSLARSCFFGDQCNPLYLKAMGSELRSKGRPLYTDQDWKALISHLQAQIIHSNDYEQRVLCVLQSSFDRLAPGLQDIFTNLVNCMCWAYTTCLEQCQWLSMVYDGCTAENIREQLLELEYHGLLEIQAGYISIHDLHKLVAKRGFHGDSSGNYLFEGDLSTLPEKEREKFKYMYAIYSDYIRTSSMRILMHCSNLEILIVDGLNNVSSRILSMQSMKSLRHLHLRFNQEIKEIKGWEGVPNLLSLYLSGFSSLKKIGNLGCLVKLKELALIHCDKLEMQTIAYSNKHLKYLVSVGHLPKLQILDLDEAFYLVDVESISNFSSLHRLRLSACEHVIIFPNMNLSSLRYLDLSSCHNLKTMEGTLCSLTALEVLNLSGCHNLISIPNLRNLARLRTLCARGCYSLKELRLGDCAFNSLETLDLLGCSSLVLPTLHGTKLSALQLIDLSSHHECREVSSDHNIDGIHVHSEAPSRLPVENYGSFVKLKKLNVEVAPWSCGNVTSLDVRGLASLEVLSIKSFRSLQEISFLSFLMNLRILRCESCLSLEELKGLHLLTKLSHLHIQECSSMVQILGLGPHLSQLKEIEILNCSLLGYLPRLIAVTSLRRLRLQECAALQAIPMVDGLHELKYLYLGYLTSRQEVPRVLPARLIHLDLIDCPSLTSLPPMPPSLKRLSVVGCFSLTDLSNLTTLTSLEYLYLQECSSLRELPNLKHLSGLYRVDLSSSCFLKWVQVAQMVNEETDVVMDDSPAQKSTLVSRFCCL